MGPFDKIAAALSGKADQGGLNNGHTTSGMDAAMQAHADQQHPVGSVPDTKIGKSPLGFQRPNVKPPGGYALKLPGDPQ